MDDRTVPYLPEKDYQAIIDLIGCFHQCVTIEDLNAVLESRLLPLVNVEMLGFAWTNRDFSHSPRPVRGLIHGVGMGDHPLDKQCLVNVGSYHKTLIHVVGSTHRITTAVDVDYPREDFKKEIAEFVRDHPEYKDTQYARANASMALIDRPDLEIGLGLCRIAPNEALFTLREVRIMELLHPSLLRTAKTIALNTSIKTYRALIEVLSSAEGCCALVLESGRVLFNNAAFSAVVPVKTKELLPDALRCVVEQQISGRTPGAPPESSTPPMTFYSQAGNDYRVSLTDLHPEDGGEDRAWLLRLHPAVDPYTAIHLSLQQAGLTPREVEVAILVGDGLADGDIAQRRFISPSTLKNHLKHIYQKLDVHSRVQLIARLKPPQ
ncbi:helix-turn-helix domain-containing protein [Nitrospina watsonii]|uniref:HTH luxR-type domain-containing protein n=1 Tax=Nitrospina watsonii TaxID=1323948 RepID=A0ABN8VZY4_9BACT|nr:helix-turn-helix transcriptional regulator [Nitrospina watsonii]CAI2718913.1 HTH luxR-type domain-containing protein [Nitrospina watsonii]